MSGSKRRNVLIQKALAPQIQEIADREGKGYNTIANDLIKAGLTNRGDNLTPQAVKVVLPGFQNESLVELAIACLSILSKRVSQLADTDKAQRSFILLTKLMAGERPSNCEIVELSVDLEIETDQLLRVVDAVAPKQDKTPNGNS